MKKYMLDTNIVSYLIRQNAAVVERISVLPVRAICISAITEGELLFGLAKRPDATSLHMLVHELLRCVDVLPWDTSTAKRYGTVRAKLASKGNVLAPLDLLIATHAMSVDAVLVTSDKAFEQVDGLEMENWV
jgi:tRNA(fMet)-specific endonuclease VapC